MGERLAIPSVGIMTDRFVSAAELMGRVLGADGYPFVVIEHPIASASPAALADRAEAAADRCIAQLVAAAAAGAD
ncbi:MAG: hypothetical protein AAF547_16685 [Actinomycetota bacterium]